MRPKIFSMWIEQVRYWFDEGEMARPHMQVVISRATGASGDKILNDKPRYYHCTRSSVERVYRAMITAK